MRISVTVLGFIKTRSSDSKVFFKEFRGSRDGEEDHPRPKYSSETW